MPVIATSIGTATRDYSTITLWEADLDNGGVYAPADDAVGECYNDSPFDEVVTIDGGGALPLNSITLSVEATQRHDGTAGNGARFVQGGNSTSRLTLSTALSIIAEWLEMDGADLEAIDLLAITNTNGFPYTARNFLIHSINRNLASAVAINGNATGQIKALINSVIYSVVSGTGTASAVVFNLQGATRLINVQNVTCHDITTTSGTAYGINCADQIGNTLQNIMATDCQTACYSQAAPANLTQNNNLASDDSDGGTGSIGADDGVLTANQYVSTVLGSEDLHLKAGADAINAGADLGTTPPGVNIDIDGEDRTVVGGALWDMGADEFTGGAPAQKDIYLGGAALSQIFLGSTEIVEVYQGSTKIWDVNG